MNIMSVSGINKNVKFFTKALATIYKGWSILAISQKLNHEPDLREYYEDTYQVKIHC